MEWFAISIVLFFIGAYYYIRYKNEKKAHTDTLIINSLKDVAFYYLIYITLLKIKDNDNGMELTKSEQNMLIDFLLTHYGLKTDDINYQIVEDNCKDIHDFVLFMPKIHKWRM